MPYWDERVEATATSYPHRELRDAPRLVRRRRGQQPVRRHALRPRPACTGTIGIAPSANINPERRFPSLFEPVHGSAPDIAGRAIANPLCQICCASMMLDHLGEPTAAAAVLTAIETVLARGGDTLTRTWAAPPAPKGWARPSPTQSPRHDDHRRT
jgi:tartrate dehydrogenase/decarboxylase/D-malate dehydrogenase